ncbi:phospholipase D-like domain-containing protein [Pseudorhizobium flavum]|uniref:Phospholipase D n=1 Tax=Pseudorhizobium flavum TaxID=1335061 RepID=A0A7X0DE70_9HYPH|nr:phospholipase D-like domain-containing protein [Pseudorhizobium flavum]MBB6181683.1 phosphatidylserine/phosphatidylglycerophosphate/cardiolipin synthase-like enzyme [Pseudorhizobium flavum]CAD6616060.1 phospholipase [Pseudorhizobium flavum]
MDVTTTAFPADQESRTNPIIKPGHNAWRSSRAEKTAFLVDGADYFRRLDQVLEHARRSIFIIGWDFNPDIRLRPEDPGCPTLGERLRILVESRPDLEVRLIVWGMGPVYSGKSLKMFGRMDWSDHERITLKFDFDHPLRASHHQKIVAIDDKTAFLGGIDLTARRWDDREHRSDNPLRKSPDGTAYGPVHDVQSIVTGPAAVLIGDVARRRWRKLTGETLQPLPSLEGPNPWPDDLDATLRDCSAALALTEAWKWKGRRGHREAIRLTHDALRAAERHLYIETQYLASFGVARTIARRLKEPRGPEIVVVVTRESHGFVEQLMMGKNRNRLIRRLMRADRYNRLRVYYAVTPDAQGNDREIVVHSKVIIVDDRFIRVGSSNLNNRSEGLDTECDIALETYTAEGRQAIERVRDDLIAEHLDASPEQVSEQIRITGSLIAAIDALNTSPRGLRQFHVGPKEGDTESVVGTGIIDPKQPFWPIRPMLAFVKRSFSRLTRRLL